MKQAWGVLGWLLWSAVAQGQEPTAVPTPAPRTRDCLAGLCLGDVAKSQVAPLATVAGAQWLRTADVCAGKIVQIYVVRGWAQPGFDWTDLPPAAVTQLGVDENGQRGLDTYNLVVTGMKKLGWVGLTLDTVENTVFYANPKTFDLRGMTFARLGEYPQGWMVAITSIHADRNKMCEKKNLEGL